MSLLVFCPRAQHTAGTPGCIEASVFEVGLKLLSRNLIITKDSAVSAPTPGWVIKTSSLGKLLGQLRRPPVPRHWEYRRSRYDATNAQEEVMEIDKEKVDEITLALLYLTSFKDKHGVRAWKSHD
jgi:hypothetical protein